MVDNKPTRGALPNAALLLSMLSLTFAAAQDAGQISQIQQQSNLDGLYTLRAQFQEEAEQKAGMFSKMAQKGQWGLNEKGKDGSSSTLFDIGPDGTPLYYTTHDAHSSELSRANTLYAGGDLNLGLSGTGMRVGIWDSGIARTSHQEFDSRAHVEDEGEMDNHATLVTGIVIASGIKEEVKGVAYAAEAMSFDWFKDKMEVTEAVAEGLLLSNHSYGIKTDMVPDWYFGAYIRVSQDWDNIMYNAPYYLMVSAAGNAQNSMDNSEPSFGKSADGFDLLTGFGTSKNGLVVAAADASMDAQGNIKNATVSGYSSLGPVDDGRIKPDLAGDGALLQSTSATNNTCYSSSMGTSMAAPGVTGALLLIQEYHQELYGSFMKSATLKGLALHTADDVQEPGPDYKMGWGVINAKRAVQVVQEKDFSSLVSEQQLEEGQTYSITVKANGNETLSASISWTDPAGQYINRGELNSRERALVHDLDIRVTKDGETFLPWKLNPARVTSAATKGDNLVDPYERIDIPNASGEYTITISHKGALINQKQDFSLVVSGLELTACSLDIPSGFELNAPHTDTIALEWASLGEEALYELLLEDMDSGNTEAHTLWENSFALDHLTVGATYTVRVRSVCSENLASSFSNEIRFTYQGAETILKEVPAFGQEGELSIKVYPNPVVNELRVMDSFGQDAQFRVFSSTGTMIKNGTMDSDAIGVNDLSSGLYVLQVEEEGVIKSGKFFKN